MTSTGNAIVYLYDAFGSPVGFCYRTADYAANQWDRYFYGRNAQGDIVFIYSSTGTILAEYTYDAWGNFTVEYSNGGADTTAIYNNLTYRGYVYDSDLGLYALTTRYYDSNIGRFINADTVDALIATPNSLTDKNLYAYCDNNPVMRVDYGGEFWHILAGAIAGAIVGAATQITTNLMTGKPIMEGVLTAAGAGAVSGALAATGLGPVVQVTGNALISATEGFVDQGIENGFDDIAYDEIAYYALIDGMFSVGNGLSKGASNHLMTQGINAAKQIPQKGISKTAKYYFAQTAKAFYIPLAKDSIRDIFIGTSYNIIKNYVFYIIERNSNA